MHLNSFRNFPFRTENTNMASTADEMRVAIDDAAGGEEERGDLLMEEKKSSSVHRGKSPAPAVMPAVDPAKQRFPFCIVWSPIPVLTWVLPFIGHLGIADSKG
ncbi:Transmembrane protein, partial [Globisporangium splendens]